jgi:hypothetical protein
MDHGGDATEAVPHLNASLPPLRQQRKLFELRIEN